MHIKNKYLRFVVSVFIALILYFLLELIILVINGLYFDFYSSLDFVLDIFILHFRYPTLITISILSFFIYVSYTLLTPEEKRSEQVNKYIKIFFGFFIKLRSSIHIKISFLRLIISIAIPFGSYFFIAKYFADHNSDDVFEVMMVFAVYGIFIVLPFLIFTPFIIYTLLSPKSKRSKSKVNIAIVLAIILLIIGLVYVDAMTIDLLDEIF